jgi:hypothetical protein
MDNGQQPRDHRMRIPEGYVLLNPALAEPIERKYARDQAEKR